MKFGEKRPDDPSRREFLRTVGGAVVATGLGISGADRTAEAAQISIENQFLCHMILTLP